MVYLFDLSAPHRYRMLRIEAINLAYAPSGRFLLTFGRHADSPYRSFRLWDVESLRVVGTRRIPITVQTDGPSRGHTIIPNVRSLADDSGRETIAVGPLGFSGAVRMIDDRRALASSSSIWSFRVVDGAQDWYPDAVTFGRGRFDGDIAQACAITIGRNSNLAQVWDVAAEQPGLSIPLADWSLARPAGQRLPKLVASDDCRFAAVVHQTLTRVYDTHSGQSIVISSADAEAIHILRTHAMVIAPNSISVYRLSDGVKIRLDVEGSVGVGQGDPKQWWWVEAPGNGVFMPVGVETVREPSWAHGEAKVSAWLWRLER